MRIIAGKFRGRRIEAPGGTDTRPTAERVREALMSSLYSLRKGFDNAVVLDAFAGSGALGLEALSRGADSATFFESDKKAAHTIEHNIAQCALESAQVRVVRQDVFKHPPLSPSCAFNLVFLDPPYNVDAHKALSLITTLWDAQALADDVLISYEYEKQERSAVEDAINKAGCTPLTWKRYGKVGLVIFTCSEKQQG